MKKLHKIICSNCDKCLGSLLIDTDTDYPHSLPSFLPFLLSNEVYEGESLSSMSISDDIKSPIYCSDCAAMRGKEE